VNFAYIRIYGATIKFDKNFQFLINNPTIIAVVYHFIAYELVIMFAELSFL